jgi:LacI family transcriptional regulator
VSIASVSRVLQGSGSVSDKTRLKVLQAADELNYVPLGAARSLAVRHHEAHGLVLPELAGPYYSELLIGFETRASELGQSVMLLLSDGKPDLARAVRRLATRVDGLVILGSLGDVDGVVQGLRGTKPVIVIAGHPQPGIEAIGAENQASARDLTSHLIGHGRRRLLFVGDPDSAPDVADRYEGFVAALGGLPLAPPVRIPFREADGVRFAERVLAGEFEADAIVCANDELALSILTRLQDGGLDVPRDLAIVGWDDVMSARYVRPGLTTVRQPVLELGRLAADRLHERIQGAPARDGLRVLPTRVVLRGSCGCEETPAARRAATLSPSASDPSSSDRSSDPPSARSSPGRSSPDRYSPEQSSRPVRRKGKRDS